MLYTSAEGAPTVLKVISGRQLVVLLPQDVPASHLHRCSSRCDGGTAHQRHNHLLNPGIWFANMLPQYWNDVLYGQPAVTNAVLAPGEVLLIPQRTVYSTYNLEESVAAVWK